MTFFKFVTNPLARKVALVAGALALAACAGDVDDTTGSRLEQAPPGTKPEPPIEAGDIAIAGQEFSHAIRQLPQVSDAAKPPLVQFTGVTSIVNGPVDTEPYTTLLRDRLLLGDREKLRFVERQLPPLVTSHRKGHGKAQVSDDGSESPDFQVLAELRGKTDADFYRIQIEFVDFHTGQVLFNGTYRIRKETADGSGGGDAPMSSEYAAPAASAPDASPSPPPPPPQFKDTTENSQAAPSDAPPVVFRDH
jgi:hypothetical protein